ncbi:MAG: hypothetical protein ACRDVG_03140 [Jatrophihabitantaceae bacterium]
MTDADIDFYFDPVCPFAWMTSKWVRLVTAQREYTVDWRLISLRMINAHIDYDAHFPAGYEAGHTAGLRLLRVAAAVRAERGNEGVAAFYRACGTHVFDAPGSDDDAETRERRGTREFVEPILRDAGLPIEVATALDDDSFDPQIREETDHALTLTGKDVGTPIIQFRPPSGVAFFGPVISRLPAADDAVRLWDHVIGLASFPGFAELKRSLREVPQLRALGMDGDAVGVEQDWHGGSRRLKK